MGRLRLAIAMAALALPLVSAASSPAAGSDARERAAAKAFADAAAELTVSVRQTAPTVRINREAIRTDCFGRQLQRAKQAGVPSDALGTVAHQGNGLLHELVYEPTIPALERFVARLDRVRTSDRVLRAGRAAWRRHLAAFRVYAALNVPLDACAQLTAWVDGGGSGPLMPSVDFTAALRELQSGGAGAREQRMREAAAQLRARGQTKQRADRFGFSTAFAEHVAIYAGVVASYGPVG
ncbi:MAG: hypothetical protein ACEQSX_10790 [Baekduiaceae bacterium]